MYIVFSVCERSRVEGAVHVKKKLDFIIRRANALEKELRERRIPATDVSRTEQEPMDTGEIC